MRPRFPEALVGYGFPFLEKLHSPIFLLKKNGTIVNVNEAGRKFLRIANLSSQLLGGFIQSILQSSLNPKAVEYCRIPTGHKHIKLVAKHLEASDYYLVEVHR